MVTTETSTSHPRKPTGSRGRLLRRAVVDAFRKLNPRSMVRNPVMFVVEVGSLLTTALWIQALLGQGEAPAAFIGTVALWLWFTVLFANFSEALAEGRGKAQADALRRTRQETQARRLRQPRRTAPVDLVSSTALRQGDAFLVEVGDIIPADGEVIEGIASVDESAVTGESAPVIRESGGDRSAVTGGTRLLSDWLVIRVTANPGEGFLDRMIGLIEGAKRQKTPNEIALNILLAAFTIIFLVVCITLLPFSLFSVEAAGQGAPVTITVLIALLVCLIPTTIGGLLSAIGIAGMDRMIQRNVIAMSGRAVEAAGDVDVLLLDKTGTITLGNRQAVAFTPVHGVDVRELAEAAQLASLADETPEGRSIVVLAKEQFSLRGRTVGAGPELHDGLHFVPFTAQTRISGVDMDGVSIRKGAPDTMLALIQGAGYPIPSDLSSAVDAIARGGGTPLVVTRNGAALGVIHLKDIVKGGINERFAHLRKMGIKTVMITGDNPLTAAAIAAEAGVDDFLAQATPEAKLKLIREFQVGGRLVAMTGDGTNDAPALAQADVAVAMNTGTQPAREAANMIDLDSNPTKLIEIVEIGKQLLMTRGSLTTFSISNDVAKYFVIIPAAFASTYPALGALNFMGLATPQSAILSAVIFNALVIVAQITGVVVRETLPDSEIDQATEIRLVDLPPAELVQRLNDGKVYVPEQAQRAVEKFFRLGNLTALREISLRRTAERVDDQMRSYMQTQAILGPWPAAERLLVCISPSPLSEKLIRAARRLADELNAEWFALNVETASSARLPLAARDQLARNLLLAETLGTKTAMLPGQSVVDVVLDYARSHNITKIIAGKPLRPRWQELLRGSVVDRLIRNSGPIDVYVISSSADAIMAARPQALIKHQPWRRYGLAAVLVAGATLLGQPLARTLDPTNLVMIYLAAVVAAAVYLGAGPAILASVLSVLAFDVFFVEPLYTLVVADTQYVLTFAGLLIVGVVISTLTARAREQADAAMQRETETAALYELSRDLAAVIDRRPDLVILDLGLPGMDGIQVTQRLREWTQIPIIVLSVRDQEGDKIAALDAGADDYLTKPFGIGELLARLRVALRRAAAPGGEPVFSVGDLTVDLARRLVTVSGQEVQLTPTEFDLLRAFVAHVGKVLTHRHLLRQVWGLGYEDEAHMLRVNIHNLRRKIEPDPSRPTYIVTEPGVGYRLRMEIPG